MKTVRLDFPQWQGGNNPDYVFGSELLKAIVPVSLSIENICVPVNTNFHIPLEMEDGIEGGKILKAQMEDAQRILESKNPDKIIVLGGDCSVSQVPFDFLSKKYGEKLGVLWLDAHPDVATIETSTRNHEMVLNNLISGAGSSLAAMVKNPINKNRVMIAGLIYEELRKKDQNVNIKRIPFVTPAQLFDDSNDIIQWIEQEDIQYLAVHFDLDVLSPQDFRSIYPAEPHLAYFDTAIGKLNLKQIERIFGDVSKYSSIVGLTIAEHLPWDALRFRKLLSNITIFNE